MTGRDALTLIVGVMTIIMVIIVMSWKINGITLERDIYQKLFATESLAHDQTLWRHLCYVAKENVEFYTTERCEAASGSWDDWKTFSKNEQK